MKKFLIFILLIGFIIFGYWKIENNENSSKYSKEYMNVIKLLKEENQKLILSLDSNDTYIELIKNENFNEDNLLLYLDALKNLNIEETIYVVNNNFYDNDIEYNENTLELMHSKYYIHKNLKRYLSYQDLKENKIEDVIKNVNSNLDYNYYTNMKKTDLSKKYLILVNKYNYLEKDYIPDNLVLIDSKYGINGYLEMQTYNSFIKMADDAKKEDVNLYASSPYRSYTTQYNLYNRYAARDGYTLADTYSARAGSSEHQTGLAIDITKAGGSLDGFENTKEFKWLQKHANEYGFILRYPEGKEYITGYQYEPWHYRYVGIEEAKKINDLDITFEEYYAYFIET